MKYIQYVIVALLEKLFFLEVRLIYYEFLL